MAGSFDFIVKGNFDQVRKGFVKLSKEFEDLSKKQLGFKLSPDAQKFFREGGKSMVSRLKDELKDVNREMEKLARTAGKSAEGFERFQGAATRAGELTKQIGSIERAVGRQRGGGGGLAGQLAGRFGGDGPLGMLAKAPLPAKVAMAVAATMTAGAYSFGKRGYGTFREQMDPRLGLMGKGMGRGQIDSLIQGGRGALSSPNETLQMLSSLLPVVGNSSISMTTGLQRYNKGLGIDGGTLVGAAGGLRQQGLAGDQLQKRFADMIGLAVSSEIDRSRLGEFVEQTSRLLTAVSARQEVGSGSLAESIARIMRVSGEGFFGQPGGAVQGMMALDQSIRQGVSGGGQLGFTTSAFEGMFPGASANKIVTMMQRGAFGEIDPERLMQMVQRGTISGADAKELQGASPARIMRSMMQTATPMLRGEDIWTKMQTMNRVLPGMDPLRALEMHGIATSDKFTETEKQEKIADLLEDLTTSEMDRLNKTTEGMSKSVDIIRDVLLQEAGYKFAPTVDRIREMYFKTQGKIVGGEGKEGLMEQMLGSLEGLSAGPGYVARMSAKHQTMVRRRIPGGTAGGLRFKHSHDVGRFGDMFTSAPNLKLAAMEAANSFDLLSSSTTRTPGEQARLMRQGKTNLLDGSSHVQGRGMDFSIHHMTEVQVRALEQFFDSRGHDAFVHGSGDNRHLHVSGGKFTAEEMLAAQKEMLTMEREKREMRSIERNNPMGYQLQMIGHNK